MERADIVFGVCDSGHLWHRTDRRLHNNLQVPLYAIASLYQELQDEQLLDYLHVCVFALVFGIQEGLFLRFCLLHCKTKNCIPSSLESISVWNITPVNSLIV